MTAITIRDGAVVPVDMNDERDDLLWHRLRKSVKATCKHTSRECISTSESGSNTCFVQYRCLDPVCGICFTEELTPGEYDRMLAQEFGEGYDQ